MLTKEEKSYIKDIENCYEAGRTIEYYHLGKWNEIPRGLPINFSKFIKKDVRLKAKDPTYEEVMELKETYDGKRMPDENLIGNKIFKFCLEKDLCRHKLYKSSSGLITIIEFDFPAIARYYNKKEFLPGTSQEELQEIFQKKMQKESTKITSFGEYISQLPDKDAFKYYLKEVALVNLESDTCASIAYFDRIYNVFATRYNVPKEEHFVTLEDYIEATFGDDEENEGCKFLAFLGKQHPEIEASTKTSLDNLDKYYNEFLKNTEVDLTKSSDDNTNPISLDLYCKLYLDDYDKINAFKTWFYIAINDDKKRPSEEWRKYYLKFSPVYEENKLNVDEISQRNKMIDTILNKLKGINDKATARAFMSLLDYIRWELS